MKTGIILAIALAVTVFFSCSDITKGYLEVGEAGYVTDTLIIHPDSGSGDSIPYQSEKIQGVIGTFPIYYELAAVKDEDGKPVPEVIAAQISVVRKAIFQIAKDHTIPVGVYSLDLRIWNMGRSYVLTGIYTIVVEEDYGAETSLISGENDISRDDK